MTSRFERKVLRGFMHAARAVGNFPTRRPKERPPSLPLIIKRGDAYERDDLPIAEFPAVLHLPQFEPAAYFHPRPQTSGIDLVGYEAIGFGPTPAETLRARGGSATTATQDWDVASYVRLLAKISLGLVVDTYGFLPLDEVPILPVIRGELADAGMWIGSADFRLRIEDQRVMHASGTYVLPHRTDSSTGAVFVRLKLFANAGATGVEVVVWTPQVELV